MVPRAPRSPLNWAMRPTTSVFLLTILSPTLANSQDTFWSATTLSVTLRDTVATAERGLTPGSGLRLVEISGLFRKRGPDSASFALKDIRLILSDSGIPTRMRRRDLLGIGLHDNSGRCLFLPLPLPPGDGRESTALIAADGTGFRLAIRAGLVTLTKNPEVLCLAFGIPERPIKRSAIYLADAVVPIDIPGSR